MSGQVVGVQNSDTAPYSRFTCSKNAMAAKEKQKTISRSDQPMKAPLNEPINERFHPAKYGRLICIHRAIIYASVMRTRSHFHWAETRFFDWTNSFAWFEGGAARWLCTPIQISKIDKKSFKNSFNLEMIRVGF